MVPSISFESLENKKRHICVCNNKDYELFSVRFFSSHRLDSFNSHCYIILGFSSFFLLSHGLYGLFVHSGFIDICFRCVWELSPISSSHQCVCAVWCILISSHNLIVDKYALANVHCCLLFGNLIRLLDLCACLYMYTQYIRVEFTARSGIRDDTHRTNEIPFFLM